MHPAIHIAMSQLVVRIDGELLRSVDALIDDGLFESRSDATRVALGQLVDTERRRRVGEAIVDGYRRQPQDEALWSDRATVEMILEEPW